MIQGVLISRRSDGYFLCEFFNPKLDDYTELRREVKRFLKTENARDGNRDFVDIGRSVYLGLLSKDGLTIMTICSQGYPKQLAKAFSIETLGGFQDYLENTYGMRGPELRSKIETIDEPYQFVSFDRKIEKSMKSYEDVDSEENITKINSELYNIQNALTESFSLLMDKDNSVNKMGELASSLSTDSYKLKKEATKVRLTLQMRKYLLFGVIGVFILAFVYLKFF